jgi:hypothetical protein
MFPANCGIKKEAFDVVNGKAEIKAAATCCNPSHAATIAAANSRFGIELVTLKEPPQVALKPGDSIIVMGVRGLGRLTDRHEYTEEEIQGASFVFSKYTVIE